MNHSVTLVYSGELQIKANLYATAFHNVIFQHPVALYISELVVSVPSVPLLDAIPLHVSVKVAS
jgi:hypothetical protein